MASDAPEHVQPEHRSTRNVSFSEFKDKVKEGILRSRGLINARWGKEPEAQELEYHGPGHTFDVLLRVYKLAQTIVKEERLQRDDQRLFEIYETVLDAARR